MGSPGHQLCGLCAWAVPEASPSPATTTAPVSSAPAMIRLGGLSVFMCDAPSFVAASHGHLLRIMRPTGAESIGNFTYFVPIATVGYWLRSLSWWLRQ